MEQLTKVQDFKDAIVEAANDRYQYSFEGSQIELLLSTAPDILSKKSIIQLKRNNNTSNNWRTILISIIDSINQFDIVLNWVANVRDELLDPEASDLYLIAAITSPELSIDICTNIESNDKFCRKYLLRPQETIEGLLGRTFLNPLTNEASEVEIVDPLHTALANTLKNLPWFTSDIQAFWKVTLLSGKTSADLIDNLFTDNFISQQNDEAPTENNNQ